MSNDFTRRFDQGRVDSRDRGELNPGECQEMIGAYYKPGDPNRVHKLDGRSTFGDTSTAAKVAGIALCKFDSGGTDQLLALSGGVLYNATPGATGTFSSLYTPPSGATSLDAAHANDEWFLALKSGNQVLSSDGTTRGMGMQPPSEAMSVSVGAAGSLSFTDFDADSGWTDMANAYDTGANNLDTFSYSELSSAGSDVAIWTAGGTQNSAGRRLRFSWALEGKGWSDRFLGDGPKVQMNARVTVKFEVSQNGGTSYTTVVNNTGSLPIGKRWTEFALTDSYDIDTQLKLRATFTYVSGTATMALRVYSIKVIDSGGTGKTATKMLYAYTEFDQTKGDQGESVPSPITAVTLANQVPTFTFPSAAVNSRTTHWRVYRTPDGGDSSSVHQLGLIAEVPVAQTNFVDDFDPFDTDQQPLPLINYIEVRSEDSTPLRFARDNPPPNLRRLTYFKGGLVGLSDLNTRALYASVPGFPESWPQIYVVEAFPLPENDQLVDVEEVGSLLIIGAKEAMIRMEEIPRSINGVLVATEAVAIKGAPGVVGDQGMTAVNYQGTSHLAWISQEDGVLVTDGFQWRRISDDLNWSAFNGIDKSNWVLTYYKHLHILRMDYSSTDGGGNDRYLFFHLDQDHLKPGGRAKITGKHYGKTASVAVGQVSNTTRVYTAHWSDGKVYVDEDSGTGLDSSNAYNSSSAWPLDILDRRIYGPDWTSYSVLSSRLYHTDFGAGQTVSVAHTSGRDSSSASSTTTKTVSLAGNSGTQFNVNRSGEWHEQRLTHTGTGRGAISRVDQRIWQHGEEGKMAVVR